MVGELWDENNQGICCGCEFNCSTKDNFKCSIDVTPDDVDCPENENFDEDEYGWWE